MQLVTRSKRWWLLCLLLSAVSLTGGYSQDSACYSNAENAAITRALLELQVLRPADSARIVAIGHYRAQLSGIAGQLRAALPPKGWPLGRRRRLIRRLEAVLNLLERP